MGESQEDIKGANMLGCEISEDMRDPLRPILQMCKWHHPDENMDILHKAYKRAVKQHTGQRRKSGEPYIIHPLL